MMPRTAVVAAVVSLSLVAAFVDPATAQDIKGSSDHPVVARYKGATIAAQTRQDFDEWTLPLGPADKSEKKFKKEERLEGKVWKTLYQAPAGASPLAIFRTYQNALKQSGFETLYECKPDTCSAEGSVINTLGYSGTYLAQLGGHSPTDPSVYLFTARHPKKNAWVNVVAFSLYGNPSSVWYTVNVVEVKPLQAEMVVVKAEAMAADITSSGHVAVYGIYFDSGKAILKPESKQALDEITKLLKQQPALKLHVVGHTDNQGTFASNLTLSKQRAEAVVASLVKSHGIAAARLTPNGVASLAPVASNATDEGRAKNRRVELVAQ